MIDVGVLGIALAGPGLDGPAALPMLRQPARWRSAPTVIPVPARLPATERRRAGPAVRLAVALADAACADAGIDPALPATVFASSTGEPGNCHALCEALATPTRAVSPTRFTNSVHNAGGGYWHIAVQSHAASTSIAAHDASFAAGLLEAAAQCAATGAPVLLVASDVPYPEPLHALRPLADAFGVALLLGAGGGRRLGIGCSAGTAADATRCGDAGLDAVRRAAPAARALPLLQALARREPAQVAVAGPDGLLLVLDVS